MKIEIEITATDEHCGANCWFLGWSGRKFICSAFHETAEGRKRPRSIRILRDDFGKFERCQQCKDAQVPNGEVRGASRLAGEASSAEGATSTVVLERGGEE